MRAKEADGMASICALLGNGRKRQAAFYHAFLRSTSFSFSTQRVLVIKNKNVGNVWRMVRGQVTSDRDGESLPTGTSDNDVAAQKKVGHQHQVHFSYLTSCMKYRISL